MPRYYAKLDRAGHPTEIREVETTSAWKCLAAVKIDDSLKTITVFRKRTLEIMSRVRYEDGIGCFCQVSHPKYIEDY